MAFRRLERELSTLTEEDKTGVSSGEKIKNRRDQDIITNVVRYLVKIVRTESLELVMVDKIECASLYVLRMSGNAQIDDSSLYILCHRIHINRL